MVGRRVLRFDILEKLGEGGPACARLEGMGELRRGLAVARGIGG